MGTDEKGRLEWSVPRRTEFRSFLRELVNFSGATDFLWRKWSPSLLREWSWQNYKMLCLESPCGFISTARSQLSVPPFPLFQGTAFSGIHCWLLVNTPGRQGDVTRPGGRWYQLPPVAGTLTKSLLPHPTLWLCFPLPAWIPTLSSRQHQYQRARCSSCSQEHQPTGAACPPELDTALPWQAALSTPGRPAAGIRETWGQVPFLGPWDAGTEMHRGRGKGDPVISFSDRDPGRVEGGPRSWGSKWSWRLST